VVPDARVEAPAPLFELALKYVPRSRARLAPNVRRRAVRAPPKERAPREPEPPRP
jgi:hypothetical protein